MSLCLLFEQLLLAILVLGNINETVASLTRSSTPTFEYSLRNDLINFIALDHLTDTDEVLEAKVALLLFVEEFECLVDFFRCEVCSKPLSRKPEPILVNFSLCIVAKLTVHFVQLLFSDSNF